ncbi:MAG TPA: hypothetical protein DDW73_04705 [Rhizobium sp.]|nr:hypothetical protein [Rhizobium sp.]
MEYKTSAPGHLLIAGQHHAQRVRNENGYGKTGRMRPDWKPKTLPRTAGELGLRSRPYDILCNCLFKNMVKDTSALPTMIAVVEGLFWLIF